MRTRTRQPIVALLLAVSLAASSAQAGGPLVLASPGVPFAFNSFPVPVYTDLGDLGTLTNATADALTAGSLAEWNGVATSTFNGVISGDIMLSGSPTDIDGSNIANIVGTFNGGGIHVVYDHDGSILTGFFGAPPGVLGIGGPDFGTGSVLDESWVVLNGTAVNPGDLTGTNFQGVITHELGHALNLAHSQTNGAILFFGDERGPRVCSLPYGGGPGFADAETMYPFLDPGASIGAEMATVEHPDDVSALSDLYPAAGWPASHATIQGTVYMPDGTTPVTGVNVIARNLADPFGDAVSALTGDMTQGAGGPDGSYTLHGLTPGASYVVYVDEIVAGGFSTPPAIPLPGPEEFWNATESADDVVDDVCQATPIAVTAGSPVTADIVFNLTTTLLLGDDDYFQVPLPFNFPFCGQDYATVYVGSNGFLTFGAGDTDFSETVPEFLGGPPRIAALWDDLSPNFGGSVTAQEVGGDFVVRFENVPEFPTTGSNTFQITLRPDGTFRIDYESISANDGLVGRTAGGGALDLGQTDLSAAPQPLGATPGSVYEAFPLGGNDLDNLSLEFAPCQEVPPPALATPFVCYGTTGPADGGNLLSIDGTTGAATLIGPTGLGGAPGLAVNSRGEIFATERISGDLYRLDAQTGLGTFIASTGIGFLDAIAFDANDVLYGVGFDPPNFTLWRIDAATGGVAPVGPTGELFEGLAFDPSDGQLYGSTGGPSPVVQDAIYRIDKFTGAATLVGTTGLGGGTPDILFAADMMFGVKAGSGGVSDLIQIDKNTGAGSVVGPTGFVGVTGLASFEPVELLIALNDMAQSQGVDQLLRIPTPATGVAELVGTLGNGFRLTEAMAVMPRSTSLPNALGIAERIFAVDDGRLLEVDAGTGNGIEIGDTGFQDIDGIAFHPFSRELYGVTYGSNKIVRIDINSGAGTEIASSVLLGHRPTDIAFHPDGRAFILTDETPSRIYQVDIHTGAKLGRWILTGGTSLESLIWSKNGSTLYSAADRGGFKDLVRIELSSTDETGTITFVSSEHSGFLDIEALAWMGVGRANDLFTKNNQTTDAAPPAGLRAFLHQNVPNPFNPRTRIDFDLARDEVVQLGIFDVRGRRIATLLSKPLAAGPHQVTWDGRDDAGRAVASGVYLYRIETPTYRQMRRMVLMK